VNKESVISQIPDRRVRRTVASVTTVALLCRIDSNDRTERVENAAKRQLRIIARRDEPAKSGEAQSSGDSQGDLRSRLTVFTSSDDALFELEPEWPDSNLSLPMRPWTAADDPRDSVNDEEPLFLDEPMDPPKVEPLDTSHLDALFADEPEITPPTPSSPALPTPMRVETPSVARPRTTVLIAVILAGSAAGFVLAYILLH
jgi:hypothetical protein